MEVGRIAHHQKSMSASRGYPEPLMRVGREVISVPCPVGWGAFPEIDQHVVDRAGSDPNKLPLGSITRLIVESSQDVLGGTGMVVLNKVKISNEVMECRLVPGLQEKAPCVTEDLRFQQEGVVDFGRELLHSKNGSWKLVARSLGLFTTAFEDTPQVSPVS